MSKIIVRGGRKLAGKVKDKRSKECGTSDYCGLSFSCQKEKASIHEAPPLDDVFTITSCVGRVWVLTVDLTMK